MSRSASLAAVLLAGVLALAGCSGPGKPQAAGPSPAANPIGNPRDTASPADTSPPTPPEEAAEPVLPAVPTSTPSGTVRAGGPLAACLNGNWIAPVSREFGPLGFSQRSHGTVRGGTGVLRYTFGLDRSFTITYDDVKLSLAIGTANVNGPVTGTYSLAGNTLQSVVLKREAKTKVSLGPLTFGSPDSVTTAVETLPPDQAFATCSGSQLTLQLPGTSGGGIVTFDRA